MAESSVGSALAGSPAPVQPFAPAPHPAVPAAAPQDDIDVPGALRASLFNDGGGGNLSFMDSLALTLPDFEPNQRTIDTTPAVAFFNSDAGIMSRGSFYATAAPGNFSPALYLSDTFALQTSIDRSEPNALTGGFKLGGHRDFDSLPFLKNQARAYFYYGGGAFTYDDDDGQRTTAFGAQAMGRLESTERPLLGKHLAFRLGTDLDTVLVHSGQSTITGNSKLRPGTDAIFTGKERAGALEFRWAAGGRVQADLLAQKNLSLSVPYALSCVYRGRRLLAHLELGGSKTLNGGQGSNANEMHYALAAVQPRDGKLSVGLLGQGSQVLLDSLGGAATYNMPKNIVFGIGGALVRNTQGQLDSSHPELMTTLSYTH